MDADMEEVEIVFAQRLASCEPTTRKRALKLLKEHIRRESANKDGLNRDSLSRLCKGLHYALWMQDKMLLQEELTDDICNLLQFFYNEEQVVQFVEEMLHSLSKEWPFIDRWRMDKFLMLLRRLIGTLFSRLANQNWDAAILQRYLDMLQNTLISAHSRIYESLKYHCASVWLDELDNAVGDEKMEQHICLDFLLPYIRLLADNNISDTFFRSICTDIFDTILHELSERMAEQSIIREKESEGCQIEGEDQTNKLPTKNEAVDLDSTRLLFDYARIGELLFEAGKQQQLSARRRKRIYALCKKFGNAANGVDPFPSIPDEERPMRKRGRRKN